SDFIKRICLGFNKIVLDMIESGIHESAVIMHGGAIMMLLASCAVPRQHPAEWATENGRGYTVLITPSLYHKSGIIEVTEII
ncbi:MAG: histidine phosphatase family protein, partial [Clostridia bacterium]|nr:histidine phosphatase family protein [Clostridia bacterium]